MNEVDLALGVLEPFGPEFSGGLSNHGPMVVEALHALGHEGLIAAWVDIYTPRLVDAETGSPIQASAWAESQGNGAYGDWHATFLLELREAPWRGVVGDWLPRLLPGFFAAATHGPIRVAHALRSLEEGESAVRISELAAALGYWAASFQRLPGSPGCEARSGSGPAEVLAEILPLPPEKRRQGFLSDAVRALEDEQGFIAAIATADLFGRTPGDLIGEICATAAGLYLESPGARIAYLHAVTGPAALRLMAPHLDESAQREGVGYALQAAAALHATYCQPRKTDSMTPGAEAEEVSWDELRYRAACSLEEHVIKLTEACWREDRLRSDPRLGMAAADAVAHLGTSLGGRGA